MSDNIIGDLWATPEQGIITTHSVTSCVGRPCCVHSPSNHHMVDWPMIFDFKRLAVAMRVCEHGHNHPDPDSLAYFASRDDFSTSVLLFLTLHQCDGCCLPDTMPERVAA